MKHATKEMALAAKEILEKEVFAPIPEWLKSVDVDCDDHGWFLTTRIKNRQDYIVADIKIPSVIDVDGFKLKNCILILG